ncbi:anthranilate phosphoribosyltransferase [Aquibacillus albus]|uniref:Anthranilate phosphoribosyltransferase n=1 Tax=Aquibacillus albus TaxID=1168171 RepID=A0ABS2N4Z5_9BACI|nr:anthranilate phosphoribosyltransferase [Aquibacillus albus]MBM7573219.1 anthranilate phosphoribosyltransferase [Aquibacillus albus]
MQQWLKEVARGKRGSKDLDYETTREVAQTIVDGNATDAQIAAYLVAQRIKAESPDELLAFIHVFQEHSEKLQVSPAITDKMIDFAGPYNGRNSFVATIPASILLASYGIPAFLHSSDSLPPKYGTSIKDILFELGVSVEEESSSIVKRLEECNLGFSWTEKFCSILQEMRPIREQIHVRTLLNTAEKLLNISQAKSIMMGAFHRTAINKIYPIFKGLSYDRVYIVQGLEGSEDLPVHRNSFVYQLTDDSLDSFIVKPEEYGVLDKNFDKNKKLSAKEQCDIILSILNGEKLEAYNYYYQQVLFNTGIRYYLFGAASTIKEGIEITREQLNKGVGFQQLEKWRNSQSLIKNSK